MTSYYEKYSKYKRKYFDLKKQLGGVPQVGVPFSININELNLGMEMQIPIMDLKQYRSTNETDEEYDARIKTYRFQYSNLGELNFQRKLSNAQKDRGPNDTMETLIECFSYNQNQTDDGQCMAYNENERDEDGPPLTVPPISISINETNGRYDIDNGRHRVVAHIINNNTTIMAILWR